MKKVYQSPEAEFVSLISEEQITDDMEIGNKSNIYDNPFASQSIDW